MYNLNCELHQYYVSSNDKSFQEGYFNTRKNAEAEMHNFCAERGITVDCVECDKHERRYSSDNGIEFCINRV